MGGENGVAVGVRTAAGRGGEVARLAAGRPVARVDLTHLGGKGPLLATLAECLAFPSWFGHNWDALLDVLTDADQWPARGAVVCLDGWDRFAAAHPADAATLREVLDEAAARWSAWGTPALVVLVDAPAD